MEGMLERSSSPPRSEPFRPSPAKAAPHYAAMSPQALAMMRNLCNADAPFNRTASVGGRAVSPPRRPPPPAAADDGAEMKRALQASLAGINAQLSDSRMAIRAELDKMERLEAQKGVIESELLALIPSRLEPRADSSWLEEKRTLEDALDKAKSQMELLKIQKEEADDELDSVQGHLAATAKSLSEERSRADGLDALNREHQKNSGFPVVGLELAEGQPYGLDGVWVVTVIHGGPAFHAGMKEGDVVVEVGSIPTKTREIFKKVVQNIEGPQNMVGQPVPFKITREEDGVRTTRTLVVALGWSEHPLEGKRTVRVQRSLKASSRSQSPPSGRTKDR
ncbi:hypothetical protein DIPPA_18541 [Diplonema papillatum]|nr:hypothetical protein DIPPA_18541 [Diplonema papillatum]